MRVLCVDDDKTFLRLYQSALRKHCGPDDEILVAPGAAEALEVLRTHHIDLLVTDLVMPEMGGLELLAQAKAIDPSTEVIVVTGRGSIDSAVQAMKQGARDYLTKPLNTSILLQRVDNVREILARAREAEDYRLAKDVVEENAGRSVCELEVKLGASLDALRRIGEVLAGELEAPRKVEEIAAILASPREC